MRTKKYITFIRENRTGGEFISTRVAKPGQHQMVLDATRRQYPAPAYTVHTTYTLQELDGIVRNIRRWTGDPAQPASLTKTLALPGAS